MSIGTAEGITIIVAILALIVSGLTLSRSMRKDLRSAALTEGAKNQLIEDIRARLDLTDGVAETARGLRQDMDTLKDVAAKTAGGLQQHLLDCAKGQGLLQGKMESLEEGQDRLQRTAEGLQRTIANWMRDKEHSGGVAG